MATVSERKLMVLEKGKRQIRTQRKALRKRIHIVINLESERVQIV